MTTTQQPADAILIVRIEPNGDRRTVGSAHSQSEADKSCITLARAFYNAGSAREYVTERNPKYQFNAALQVVGSAA